MLCASAAALYVSERFLCMHVPIFWKKADLPRCCCYCIALLVVSSNELTYDMRACVSDTAVALANNNTIATWRGTPSSPTYVEYLPLHLD